MSDKPLPPTPKRIQDAREEGQVPYSKDAVSLLVLGLVFELLFCAAGYWKTRLGKLMSDAIDSLAQPFSKGLELMSHESMFLLSGFSLAVLCVAVVAGLIATWATVGFVYAHKKFSKSFERMNPASFFQNLFSPDLWVDLALSIVKAGVIGAIVFFIIRSAMRELPLLSTGTLELAWQALLEMVKAVVRGVLAALILFALLDIRLRRILLWKQLRMEHSEVKREYKDSMGDPMIKAKRRMLAMELLLAPPAQPLSKANALVVNPEHYAVALHYEETPTALPLIVSKGSDELALALIAGARHLDIPVIRFRRLARLLHANGTIGEPIPREAFRAVALIYRLIEALRAEGSCADELTEIDDDALFDPPDVQQAHHDVLDSGSVIRTMPRAEVQKSRLAAR